MRFNGPTVIKGSKIAQKALLIIAVFGIGAGYQAFKGATEGWTETRLIGSIVPAVGAVMMFAWVLFVFDPVKAAKRQAEQAKTVNKGSTPTSGTRSGI